MGLIVIVAALGQWRRVMPWSALLAAAVAAWMIMVAARARWIAAATADQGSSDRVVPG